MQFRAAPGLVAAPLCPATPAQNTRYHVGDGDGFAEIAEAARAWGQNDDITVVTVRRANA